jgi:magnesium-transporting ATPase (P-type)
LALGARAWRRQVLVRKLEAETLGAVEVVDLDKTGTLTANRWPSWPRTPTASFSS